MFVVLMELGEKNKKDKGLVSDAKVKSNGDPLFPLLYKRTGTGVCLVLFYFLAGKCHKRGRLAGC